MLLTGDSTVSKILRQKDKYMKPIPKEEVTSPGKKSKVKLPDVEKTLVNWVRNQQKKKVPITDDELRKQAHMFSAGRNDQQFLASPTWLEQFKQKHMDENQNSTHPSLDTALDMSPTSDNELVSPPMSTVDERPILSGFEVLNHGFDFETRDTVFEHSDTMHESPALDMDPSAEGILSSISPDLARGDGLAMTLSESQHTAYNFSRQRSQTFHHLPEAVGVPSSRSGHKAPPLPVRSLTNISIETTRDTAHNPRQAMKRHKSVPDIHEAEAVQFSSMQPPPIPKSTDLSPISNPGSPTAQDDSIRALYNIQKLLEQRPDVAEPDDYIIIGKLMEKLKLLRSPNGTPVLPAGMNALEVAESPRISKKRTHLGMAK